MAQAASRRAEYLTLKDLRKARELTQVQLAVTLGQKHLSIAKLEKRSHLLLSTFRRYVEAMSGKLDPLVEFPDRPPVLLDGIGEVSMASAKSTNPHRAARSTTNPIPRDLPWAAIPSGEILAEMQLGGILWHHARLQSEAECPTMGPSP